MPSLLLHARRPLHKLSPILHLYHTYHVMAGSAIGILVLSALPLQLSSFVLVPALLPGLEAHQNGPRTSQQQQRFSSAGELHVLAAVGSCFFQQP